MVQVHPTWLDSHDNSQRAVLAGVVLTTLLGTLNFVIREITTVQGATDIALIVVVWTAFIGTLYKSRHLEFEDHHNFFWAILKICFILFIGLIALGLVLTGFGIDEPFSHPYAAFGSYPLAAVIFGWLPIALVYVPRFIAQYRKGPRGPEEILEVVLDE